MKRFLYRLAALTWFFGGLGAVLVFEHGWKVAGVIISEIFGVVAFVVVLVWLGGRGDPE